METVKTDKSLIDYIKEKNKIISICVPFTADSHKLANIMRKRLDKGFPEVFYVTWNKTEENSAYITYDKLMEFRSKYKKCLFIADSWQDFYMYFEELLDGNVNNNYYLMMFDNKPKKKKGNIDIATYVSNITFLWPGFADLEFKFIENKRIVFLNKKQSENYESLYNLFKKFYMNDNLQNMKVSKEDLYGNLNVYYDNIVANLSNASMDVAFNRSPKFKSIITDLLLENKKRHFIYVRDGKYGLDAFSHLYNQVKSKNNTIPHLVVIKKNDGPQEISKKLISFNSTNVPAILATDYIFTYPNIPFNIDCFKFVNGGDVDCIEMILNMPKAEFYTGTYPRSFYITSYVSKNSINMLATLDMIDQESFTKKFNNSIYSNLKCKEMTKIFVKGEDFFVSVNEK